MSFPTAADPRIGQLKELLAGSKRIAVVGHYNPDGDAVGSTLGLAHVLRAMGHTVQVVMPNNAGTFLSRLAGFSDILTFSSRPAAALDAIKKCDVLFCLDFNRSNRTGGLEEVVAAAPVRVLIDHHQDPEHFSPVMFSDTWACSTCQMVYDIVVAMGHDGSHHAGCGNVPLYGSCNGYRFVPIPQYHSTYHARGSGVDGERCGDRSSP